MHLKGRADVATLTGIQQIIAQQTQYVTKLANQNKFALGWVCKIRKKTAGKKVDEQKKEDEEDEEEEGSDEEEMEELEGNFDSDEESENEESDA